MCRWVCRSWGKHDQQRSYKFATKTKMVHIVSIGTECPTMSMYIESRIPITGVCSNECNLEQCLNIYIHIFGRILWEYCTYLLSVNKLGDWGGPCLFLLGVHQSSSTIKRIDLPITWKLKLKDLKRVSKHARIHNSGMLSNPSKQSRSFKIQKLKCASDLPQGLAQVPCTCMPLTLALL